MTLYFAKFTRWRHQLDVRQLVFDLSVSACGTGDEMCCLWFPWILFELHAIFIACLFPAFAHPARTYMHAVYSYLTVTRRFHCVRIISLHRITYDQAITLPFLYSPFYRFPKVTVIGKVSHTNPPLDEVEHSSFSIVLPSPDSWLLD